MPYMVQKDSETGKYCVHKEMDDGSAGKKMGCHDSKSEAEDQRKALYASEGKSVTTAQITINGEFPLELNTDGTNTMTITDNTTSVVFPDTTKAVAMKNRSFQEFIEDVRMEWQEQYGYSGWVIEVFEKYAIVSKDKNLWKVPYTRSGEDVELSDINEWEKVKPMRGYVAKYAPYLTAIKSLDDDTIGAYGILWGDKENKDLHGEYFTKSTEELTSVFEGMGAIPFLFNHGVDGVLKSTVIGKVTEMDADDVGLWFEAKITQHEAYKKLVQPLLQKKALYPSSGVLPAAKKVNKSGQITRWPIIEMTGTHMPAEHRMLDVPISEVNKFYKSVGLPELPDESNQDNGSENERLRLELEQQKLQADLMEIQLSI